MGRYTHTFFRIYIHIYVYLNRHNDALVFNGCYNNYCQLSGPLLYTSVDQKSGQNLQWAETLSLVCTHSGGPGGESSPCFFQSLEATHIPLFTSYSFHLKHQQRRGVIFPCHPPSDPLFCLPSLPQVALSITVHQGNSWFLKTSYYQL